MKRSFVFISFYFFIVIGIFATTMKIHLIKDPFPTGPAPHSLTFLPVIATINENEFVVYFDENVDVTTIIVCNASNLIVYQKVVNTYTTNEVYIPFDLWDSGNYTLKIEYENVILKGEFDK